MRLFVAVTLPEVLRQTLWRGTAPLRATDLPIRWVQPDGYHVTLKFLGEVADEHQDDLVRALGAAARQGHPFAAALKGLGVFPDLHRPRVLWAGLDAEPLATLQRRVDDELARGGYGREERPFHGHVTVGRAKRGARREAFRSLEGLLADVQLTGEFAVDDVELMESRLGPDGATYRTVQRITLGEA